MVKPGVDCPYLKACFSLGEGPAHQGAWPWRGLALEESGLGGWVERDIWSPAGSCCETRWLIGCCFLVGTIDGLESSWRERMIDLNFRPFRNSMCKVMRSPCSPITWHSGLPLFLVRGLVRTCCKYTIPRPPSACVCTKSVWSQEVSYYNL